jgi:hypothetical protein
MKAYGGGDKAVKAKGNAKRDGSFETKTKIKTNNLRRRNRQPTARTRVHTAEGLDYTMGSVPVVVLTAALPAVYLAFTKLPRMSVAVNPKRGVEYPLVEATIISGPELPPPPKGAVLAAFAGLATIAGMAAAERARGEATGRGREKARERRDETAAKARRMEEEQAPGAAKVGSDPDAHASPMCNPDEP